MPGGGDPQTGSARRTLDVPADRHLVISRSDTVAEDVMKGRGQTGSAHWCNRSISTTPQIFADRNAIWPSTAVEWLTSAFGDASRSLGMWALL